MPFRPAFDGQKCSLGYQVVDWLTEYACHGPGDVQGDPLDFAADPEVEEFIVDCYELDPKTGCRSGCEPCEVPANAAGAICRQDGTCGLKCAGASADCGRAPRGWRARGLAGTAHPVFWCAMPCCAE